MLDESRLKKKAYGGMNINLSLGNRTLFVDNALKIFLPIVFVLFQVSSFAQKPSIGIIGGGALTDGFQNQNVPASSLSGTGIGTSSATVHFYSPSKDYVVGAMLELRLPFRLSIEADALYRQLNISSVATADQHPSFLHVVTWEFPVLAKYRFTPSRIAPFAEMGPSFRAAGNLNDTSPSGHGLTVGSGVEVRVFKFKLAPALRYTRWAQDARPATGPPVPRTNPNQLELLVGFSY